MKTIVCGPPHSGKSIIISNLVRLMPSESFQRITANGDGEGTWSNNPDQGDVISVRHKGTNTERDFAFWKQIIDKAIQDIVLVDIGGRLQDDKGPLFDSCDSFIVVSNNEEMIHEWIKFGESHGCRCLATVLSVLNDSKDTILATNPYLQAALSGLERGHDLHGSKVLSALAEVLVAASGYGGFKSHQQSHDIDLFDIGMKLGCSRSWYSKDGFEVATIWYKPDKAKVLNSYLSDTYERGQSYRVYGAKALWVSCIVASCLGADNLEFYDEWTDCFIAPHVLKQDTKYGNDNMQIIVRESEDTVKLSFECKWYIEIDRFHEYQLPTIDKHKTLYISGRFPNWFVVSILMSYDNPNVFLHIPGKGYIKVVSQDIELLGTFAE